MYELALVREGKALDSPEIDLLRQGEVVEELEQATLDDADRTLRLRVEGRVCGWVSPYLATERLTLLEECHYLEKPKTDKISDVVGRKPGALDADWPSSGDLPSIRCWRVWRTCLLRGLLGTEYCS